MKRDASLRRAPTIAGMIALAVLACSTTSQAIAQANPTISQQEIKIQNQLLTIHYHSQTGTMDIEWRDGHKLLGITSGAQLEDGLQLSTATYTAHELEKSLHPASAVTGHEYTIRSTAPGLPELLQHIWLYDGKPWIAMEAELDPKTGTIGTRHFDAVTLKGADAIQLEGSKSLRVLHVPFDNDMWFRYNSVAAADLKPGQTFTSDEVTAIYDNASRQALILGSIMHDTWKTAIEAHAADGQLTDLDIYGGISSPTGIRTDTHDTLPHGIVHGAHVVSPRIFIGSFSDWRDGLEAYGAANAAIHTPLKWAAGAPMGWNSWAAYADKIDEQRYLGSAAFVRDKLVPLGFGNSKVVYINLDAFWSKLDAVQLSDAVATIKAMHSTDGTRFEPGIYWTPFAYWSDDLDAYVEGTNMKYRYRDILLKAPDGSFLPKVDGGRAIDPSHPGAKARAKRNERTCDVRQERQLHGDTEREPVTISEIRVRGLRHESAELDRERVDEQIEPRQTELGLLEKTREKKWAELETRETEPKRLGSRAKTVFVGEKNTCTMQVSITEIERAAHAAHVDGRARGNCDCGVAIEATVGSVDSLLREPAARAHDRDERGINEKKHRPLRAHS